MGLWYMVQVLLHIKYFTNDVREYTHHGLEAHATI